MCLNNPHAKLQDLEIKDLSIVTIMKDPKSADLAIDEEASVKLENFLIDQVKKYYCAILRTWTFDVRDHS